MKTLNNKNNFKKTSKLYFYKASIYFIVMVIAIFVPLHKMIEDTYADQYDDQIALIQAQIDAYNAEAARLANQAITYQSQIAVLQNQINAIQAEINISQVQYDQLVAQIIDTEQKIQDNKDILGTTIANMYVDDNITPLEMLVSSNNISDYLDKQEYRTSVRNQLVETIGKIKDLKAKLVEKKIAQKDVLDKQNAQKASLLAAKAQQQSLYDQTRGEEEAYQRLIADSRQALADAAAAQKAYLDGLANGGSSVVVGDFYAANWSGNQGCSGGYPWEVYGPYGSWGCAFSLDYGANGFPGVDNWQLYNRECVSYAAWKLDSLGKYVSPFYGNGMAYEWAWSAPNYSGAYIVSDPQPGDAVVLPQTPGYAPVGHLMIVDYVNSGAEYPIHVSQFNYGGTGEYSTMDIKNSGIILLRFLNK